MCHIRSTAGGQRRYDSESYLTRVVLTDYSQVDMQGLRYKTVNFEQKGLTPVDRLRVGPLWEKFCESRRCSRDTYPETYITEYILI